MMLSYKAIFYTVAIPNLELDISSVWKYQETYGP